MSILDWDNEELDNRGARAAINLELHQGVGLLYNYLRPKSTQHSCGHDCRITDDGILTTGDEYSFEFQENDTAGRDAMRNYVKDGIIAKISCSEVTLTRFNNISKGDFPEINTARWLLNMVKNIDGLVVNIFDNSKSKRYSITSSRVMLCMCDDINFKNCEINFECTERSRKIRFTSIDKFVNLNGLRSNVKFISQYTLNDFPDEFMSLFVAGGICKIYDNNKRTEVDMPVKNLKKAVAIANNPTRYRLLTHILELKPGAKFSSLIPLKNFPELEKFTIENNNVALSFVKQGTQSARPSSIARIPITQDTDYKNIDTLYPKTTDGWYVILTCKR